MSQVHIIQLIKADHMHPPITGSRFQDREMVSRSKSCSPDDGGSEEKSQLTDVSIGSSGGGTVGCDGSWQLNYDGFSCHKKASSFVEIADLLDPRLGFNFNEKEKREVMHSQDSEETNSYWPLSSISQDFYSITQISVMKYGSFIPFVRIK